MAGLNPSGPDQNTHTDDPIHSGTDASFHARLLDAVGQAVIATDPQRKIIYWNRAAQKLYGWSKEEVMGSSVEELLAHEDQQERAEEIMSELGRGKSWSGEFKVRRKDGTAFLARVTDTPIHDEQGNLAVITRVAEDITEIKQAEQLRRREERYRTLVQNASNIITILDADGTVRYDNPTIERMLGYRPNERVGTSTFELIHPEDLSRSRSKFAETQENVGVTLELEMRVRHRDGSWRHMEMSATNLLDDPAVEGIVLNWRDVSERLRAEEELKESERRLRTVVSNANVVLFTLDRDGVFTLSEGRGLQSLGFQSGELVGRSVFEVFGDVPGLCEHVRRTLGGGEVFATVEVAESIFEVFYGPLRDEEGEVVGLIGVATDVSERHALEGNLRRQAYYDALTGVSNRRLFMEHLEHFLIRAKRRPDLTAAVLFMDLNRFKSVNDSLGHNAGDRLLVAVSERLRGCLRQEDTLARFGGDEFAVLIEDVKGPTDAIRVAERIKGSLQDPFVLDRGAMSFSVGASIGIALSDAHTKGPEDLLRQADIAMYRAKKEKSGWRVFEPEMRKWERGRLALESDLRRAVENGEFVLHYQPKVNLQTGKVVDLEALVRWEHPDKGLLPPSEFIAAAEETGMIVPLGQWVIEEACRRVCQLQERYPNGPTLQADVNISAVQLRRPSIVEDVAKALRETGLAPSRLELEITESAVMEAAEDDNDALLGLKGLGVKVAIDDFGTGYSSLAYLKRLSVDTLKVDNLFVGGLGGDPTDEAILTAIVNLAHALDLRVVAEWVERADQVERLREIGCDIGQGYHFSKPLPLEAVEEFLAR